MLSGEVDKAARVRLVSFVNPGAYVAAAPPNVAFAPDLFEQSESTNVTRIPVCMAASTYVLSRYQLNVLWRVALVVAVRRRGAWGVGCGCVACGLWLLAFTRGPVIPPFPHRCCSRFIEGTAFRISPAQEKEVLQVDVRPLLSARGYHLPWSHTLSFPPPPPHNVIPQYLCSRLSLLTIAYGGVASGLWTSPPVSICQLVNRYMSDAVQFLARSSDDFR